MELDFACIEKAGLTQDDFARLAKVSRVTVNQWMRGKVKPHILLGQRIAKLLSRIEVAVGAGKLPLSADGARESKLNAIAAALTEAAGTTAVTALAEPTTA